MATLALAGAKRSRRRPGHLRPGPATLFNLGSQDQWPAFGFQKVQGSRFALGLGAFGACYLGHAHAREVTFVAGQFWARQIGGVPEQKFPEGKGELSWLHVMTTLHALRLYTGFLFRGRGFHILNNHCIMQRSSRTHWLNLT